MATTTGCKKVSSLAVRTLRNSSEVVQKEHCHWLCECISKTLMKNYPHAFCGSHQQRYVVSMWFYRPPMMLQVMFSVVSVCLLRRRIPIHVPAPLLPTIQELPLALTLAPLPQDRDVPQLWPPTSHTIQGSPRTCSNL